MTSPANSFLLPKALQTCTEDIIGTANLAQAGIRAVLLSTTEGVPLGRVVSEPDATTLHPDLLQMMESVLAPASKQLPVLGMGKLKQVTSFYDHGVIVHLFQGPVVSRLRRTSSWSIGVLQRPNAIQTISFNHLLLVYFIARAGRDHSMQASVKSCSSSLDGCSSSRASAGAAVLDSGKESQTRLARWISRLR